MGDRQSTFLLPGIELCLGGTKILLGRAGADGVRRFRDDDIVSFHRGFARSRNGAASMHAVSCLPAVTGAWQHEGGGALWSNRGMYRWNKTLIEGTDALDTRIRMLDMSRVGSVLTGDRSELGDGPQVHAMIIQNQNPLDVCPDTNRVRRGFGRQDLFVATHEQFFTQTCRWSDVVLPATMFMEHDDLYQAGGHSHIQIGPKLIDPQIGRAHV